MDAGSREAMALYLSARAGFFSVRRAPQPPFQTRAVGRAAQQRGLGVNALRGEYSSAGFIYGSSSCSVQAAAAGWRRLRIGGGFSLATTAARSGVLAGTGGAGQRLFFLQRLAVRAYCCVQRRCSLASSHRRACGCRLQPGASRCHRCSPGRIATSSAIARKAAWAFQAATEPALLCVNDLKPKKNRGEPAKTPPGPAQASSRL